MIRSQDPSVADDPHQRQHRADHGHDIDQHRASDETDHPFQNVGSDLGDLDPEPADLALQIGPQGSNFVP